jgi:multiple sugar transport system permease protein
LHNGRLTRDGHPRRRTDEGSDATRFPETRRRFFAFTLSWNELIYALAFISSTEQKTVPVGVLTELVEGDVYHWGSLMAGALLGSLPVAILYSFFVEHYVASLTGAVKE